MNVQKIARLFAIVFVIIGILGFVPGVTSGGHLLGIFEVDAVHNLIHLATGLIAFWAMGTAAHARLFFKLFGVVYALVTILGFTMGGDILGIFHANGADNILHLAIAAVALYAGFVLKK